MYGFQKDDLLPEHWQLGSGKASKQFGAAALMPGGHGWGKHLPKKEIQKRGSLETMACTVFGTANCYETLARLYGFKDFPSDLAERYNAVLAKITPQGGSPHTSCETFRLFGALSESTLPFAENIHDWPGFYSPDPMDENLVRLGQDLLTRYILGHEWVFNGNATLAQKQELLKSALARGTVAVSVFAWSKSGRKYVKAGEDNHWLQLVDYKEGEYWVVNDHYEPTEKRLAWDFDFYCAKLFFLSKNPTGIPPNFFDYLMWLIRKGRAGEAAALLLKKLFAPKTPAPVPPPKAPVAPVAPPKSSNGELLYNAAKAAIGSDITPSDHVPDNVACVAQLQAVYHNASGRFIGTGAARFNTAALDTALRTSKDFIAVNFEDAQPGDIAVCPTGKGKDPAAHGHCWIVGKIDWMSNDSDTGKWKANYTKAALIGLFVKKLGFPLYVYRPI